MTARVIFAALLIHLATAFGVIASGVETAECAGSDNYLCGTPIADLLGQEVRISPNPLKIAGTIIALFTTMSSLTWYRYAVLTESDNTLVQMYVWTVRAAFTSLALYLAYRAASVIATAVGRFFGR